MLYAFLIEVNINRTGFYKGENQVTDNLDEAKWYEGIDQAHAIGKFYHETRYQAYRVVKTVTKEKM
jgi:hypothetical protein